MPYLPHVKALAWTGPIASTSLFSFMPPSLKTIAWSRSPAIQPGPLARLLNKQVTRVKTFQQADGSFEKRQIQTIVAKGLQCISVSVRRYNVIARLSLTLSDLNSTTTRPGPTPTWTFSRGRLTLEASVCISAVEAAEEVHSAASAASVDLEGSAD